MSMLDDPVDAQPAISTNENRRHETARLIFFMRLDFYDAGRKREFLLVKVLPELDMRKADRCICICRLKCYRD